MTLPTLTFLSKIPSPTGSPEPSVYGVILASILSLAASFGFGLEADQAVALVSLVNVLAGLLIRQHVSPASS